MNPNRSSECGNRRCGGEALPGRPRSLDRGNSPRWWPSIASREHGVNNCAVTEMAGASRTADHFRFGYLGWQPLAPPNV